MADNPDPLISPLGSNPFPREDPRHAYFGWVSSFVAEGLSRVAAEYGERMLKAETKSELFELRIQLSVAAFDVWGTFLSKAARFELLNETLEVIEAVRKTAWEQSVSRPSGFSASELGRELNARLMARQYHWFAESRRVAHERLRNDSGFEQTATETAASGTATDTDESADARAKRRRAFVERALEANGLNPSTWANRANVNPSVVYRYLDGKTSLRASSRSALAEALGKQSSDLPK